MMSEPGALEDFGGSSLDFEDFEEWSSQSFGDGNAPKQDGSFGDWSCFHDRNWDGDEDSSLLPVKDPRSTGHSEKNGDRLLPWLVFSECFPAEDTPEDASAIEPLSLSQLLQTTPSATPQPAAVSSEAASLWHRLLCEPKALRLSDPKPDLKSSRKLISTLQLTRTDAHATQSMPLPELEPFEEPERPHAALIQTKLFAPPSCRGPPAFLYQVSRQWLSKRSMQLLQTHQHRKGLLH